MVNIPMFLMISSETTNSGGDVSGSGFPLLQALVHRLIISAQQGLRSTRLDHGTLVVR